jgi:Zn-dependent peptidase ImmA (M78 family)
MGLLQLDPIQAEANGIRAAAGIRPEELVPDIVAVLRGLGLVVAMRDLAWDGLDGIYASDEVRSLVLLNSGKFPYRVRCVAAHMLAHHVYGDEPHVDHDIEDSCSDPVQWRANAFAGRFLVSREAIWTRHERAGGVTVGQALHLAGVFGVTYRALVERLHDVGIAGAQASGSASQRPNSFHPPHSAR